MITEECTNIPNLKKLAVKKDEKLLIFQTEIIECEG